jgi:cyclophilin family peptidyl-prolyl cis-trans isomerase
MRLRLITLLCAAASFAVAQSPDELEAVVNTDMGMFRFEFAADKAPKHVEQFIKRARAGYYNGSAFFRVVANGLIQGGDPLLKEPKTPKKLWGTGGLNLMPGEYSDMKHERGVVSTVRIPEKPDSDGSQFFIVIYPQPQLDGKFSAFGLVNEGMDVVEKISRLPAGESNFTEKPVRIISITIGKKKVQPFLNATPDELHRTVTLKTTVGTIKIKLEPDWAPV